MQYLDFVAALNPFVLCTLAVVVACGLYDRWAQSK
ncbi:hypothetical protein J3A65_001678 [Rhizobium sp. PvP014]|nr:hypothetical protein [Rhizobium sp. PvP014]MBP2528310.1 hypothetical protein [Rhizobium sp. PvP099]